MKVIETIELWVLDHWYEPVKNKYHIISYSCEYEHCYSSTWGSVKEVLKTLEPLVIVIQDKGDMFDILKIPTKKFEEMKRKNKNFLLTQDKDCLEYYCEFN